MAKTTSDSILGVIRKFELMLTRRAVLADKGYWPWRRCAGSDCFLVILNTYCTLQLLLAALQKNTAT